MCVSMCVSMSMCVLIHTQRSFFECSISHEGNTIFIFSKVANYKAQSFKLFYLIIKMIMKIINNNNRE